MLKPKTRRDREDSQGKTAAIEDVRRQPTKRLNANVPASVYQELQVKCAKEGRKINELVNQWINDYLKE